MTSVQFCGAAKANRRSDLTSGSRRAITWRRAVSSTSTNHSVDDMNTVSSADKRYARATKLTGRKQFHDRIVSVKEVACPSHGGSADFRSQNPAVLSKTV